MRRHRGQAAVVFLAGLAGVLIGAVLVWGWMSRHGSPGGIVVANRGAALPVVSKEGQDAIIAAVKKAGPAVVNVNTRLASNPRAEAMARMLGRPPRVPEAQGSGIIIDGANGYILTNAHVVKGATDVAVQLANGHSYPAKVVGSDPLSEVAVLQVKGSPDLPTATLGHSSDLPIGAWVIAIGNPYGFQNSVTVGVLSAKDRQVPSPNGFSLQDLMQTDAAIDPGNSGGALVDLNGDVVGIPTAMIPQAHGIGFAVPIDVAKQVAERLIKSGAMPWLGIQHRPIQPLELKQLNVPDGKGSLVAGVDPNGPAETAGMRPQDVILRVGGTRIAATDEVGKLVRSHDVGQRLDIVVWREGKEVTLHVTLGAVPADLSAPRPQRPRGPQGSMP